MKRDYLNKTIAAYLGFAIGDALGATTEFMTPKEIAYKYGVHKKIIGGGWLNLKPGKVTDDTEMCICLADSIIESGGFNVNNVADYFVKWMRSKPVDIGATVRRGLQQYMVSRKTFSYYSESSAGNGACMRNLPIILYCMKEWQYFDIMTISQCHITHNNRKSDLITILFGNILRSLMLHGDKSKAYSIVSEFIVKHPKLSYLNYKGESSGYIVDTFKNVMHHFFNNNSFYDTLIGVVNQGGDADTNGALAGMLSGALYGLEAIPAKWINKLDKKIYFKIRQQSETLYTIPAMII